jgi:phosphate transport system substrate-binding protein
MSGQMTPGTPQTEQLSAPTRRRASTVGMGAAIAIAVVLLLVGLGGGYLLAKSTTSSTSTTKVTVSETGSTLIYPYLQILAPYFDANYSGVTLSPDGTGSGTGISSAESGTVDLGGTDAYLTPATAAQYNLINFPIAISSQLAVYNLPGITTHLNLNGTILSMIYMGTITNWNDPLIQAANPGVSLPAHAITPIHRLDGSGDTFLWTSLCYMSWSGWKQGFGTTITWPVGPGATGNPGMVTLLNSTTYGLAYIGISYLSEIEATGKLAYAALGDNNANYNGTVGSNGAGRQNYILPTAQNISEDASLALQNLQPPSVAITLILGGVAGAVLSTTGGAGKGGTNATAADPSPYPDTNLEYLLLSTHPTSTSHQRWVVTFLEWSLAYGGIYAPKAHFLPLTPAVIGYDMLALDQVPVSS